jgi:isopropylmalate/homocitrate/citramalate synthase
MIYRNVLAEGEKIRIGKKHQAILKNLQELGLQLNPPDLKLVTQRIIELGDKKRDGY